MTTPAINTAYGVIYDAYRDAQLLQLGDDLGGELIAEGLRRLRDLINYLQTQGLKLWLLSDTAVPLTAGQATYTFKPAGDVDLVKPLRVIQGYYLYSATNVRRPIYVLAWDDYLRLGQAGTLPANRGAISQYFVNKLATELQVTFWLCPDTTEAANGDAHVLLQTQVTNPTNLTETVQFPEEWRLALRWGLANDVCVGQPQAIMDKCERNALTYQQALEGWDVEDAPTRFEPDSRNFHYAGNFR